MVTDKKFNVDVDLQITQMESTVSGQGPYKLLMDYKGVRNVFLFSVIPV